jgi:hypothetical protein
MKIKSAFIAALALASPLTAFGEAKPKPMKVFVFAGQSNMTGMARTRTLEHLKIFPDTAAEFADLFDKDSNPATLDEVYVSQWMDKESGRLEPKYGGGKGGGCGPEYSCGIFELGAVRGCFNVTAPVKTRKYAGHFRRTGIGGFATLFGNQSRGDDLPDEPLALRVHRGHGVSPA